MTKKPTVDIEWQTSCDVETIERYQEIIKDKDRLQRAIKAVEDKVDNLSERAKALDAVSKSFKNKK